MYKTTFDNKKTKFGFKKTKKSFIEKKSIKFQQQEAAPTRQTLLLQITQIGTQLQPDLAQKFFDDVSLNDLEPMFSVLMTFLSSAMSHISVVHRLKGVKILQMAIQNYPELFIKYGPDFNSQFIDLLTLGKERLLVLETFSALTFMKLSFTEAQAVKLVDLLVAIWIENNNSVDQISIIVLNLLLLLIENYTIRNMISTLNNHFLVMFPFSNVEMNLTLILILLEQQNEYVELCSDYVSNLILELKTVPELLLKVVFKLSKTDMDHLKLQNQVLELSSRIFNKTTFQMARQLAFIENEQLISWALKLPKYLWQLKRNDLEFSHEIINLMSEMVLKMNHKDLSNFQRVLVPLFHSTVSRTAGPILKYTIQLQEKLIDLLFHLPPWDLKLCQSLSRISQDSRFPTNLTLRLFDICNIRQNLPEKQLDSGLYQSVLLSIFIHDTRTNREKMLKKESVIKGPLGKVFASNSDEYNKQREQVLEISSQTLSTLGQFEFTEPISNLLEQEQIPIYTFEAITRLNIDRTRTEIILAAIDASLINSGKSTIRAIESIVTMTTLPIVFQVYQQLILDGNHTFAIQSMTRLFVDEQLCFDQRTSLVELVDQMTLSITDSYPPAAMGLAEINRRIKIEI